MARVNAAIENSGFHSRQLLPTTIVWSEKWARPQLLATFLWPPQKRCSCECFRRNACILFLTIFCGGNWQLKSLPCERALTHAGGSRTDGRPTFWSALLNLLQLGRPYTIRSTSQEVHKNTWTDWNEFEKWPELTWNRPNGEALHSCVLLLFFLIFYITFCTLDIITYKMRIAKIEKVICKKFLSSWDINKILFACVALYTQNSPYCRK